MNQKGATMRLLRNTIVVKILFENLTKLTAYMPNFGACFCWKLVIFVCLPSNIVFRNSFTLGSTKE